MDATKYLLSKDPWDALIYMINDVMLTQLVPDNTRLVRMTALNLTYTEFEIEAHRSTDPANSMPEITRYTYTFDRLRLSAFFAATPVISIQDIRMPYSTVDIMNWISERTGIVFAYDDFIHETFAAYTGNNDVVITASPQSLRWVGSFRVRLINTVKQDIGTLTQYTVFPDIHRYDRTKQLAEFYTPQFDFTEYREYLSTVGKGPWPASSKLAAILQSVTGYPFVASATLTEHNLVSHVTDGELYYTVVWNGPAYDVYTNRTEFNRVLVLELSTDYCSDIIGRLRLHYN